MSLYDVLGPTAIPTIICLVAGLALLLVELFTPGVGVPGVTGVLCLLAVFIMQLCFGSAAAALYIAGGVLVIIIVALILFIRSLQKGRLSRSFLVLKDAITGESTAAGSEQAQDLVGRHGTAVTALRPSGVAMVDGRRVDVMTEGDFIEKDTPVVITAVQGLRILVEAAKE